MSKAILVIDMPDSCSKCPFFNDVYSDMCCRGLNNAGINYPYPEDFRQCWCPLKLVPEKDEYYLGINEYYEGRVDGWNDCLNEILE